MQDTIKVVVTLEIEECDPKDFDRLEEAVVESISEVVRREHRNVGLGGNLDVAFTVAKVALAEAAESAE